MRVWVTRTQPGADATAARLRDLGHDPIVSPVLAVRRLPVETGLSAVGALAFTSANAVDAFADAAKGARSLPVFTVGDATAAAARRAGFTDVLSAQGDIHALAELIVRERSRVRGGVLQPAAGEPAADLEALLAEHGVDLQIVPVYETVAVEPAEALAQLATIDVVLVHSPKAARRLADLVAGAAAAPRFACISEAAARRCGPPATKRSVRRRSLMRRHCLSCWPNDRRRRDHPQRPAAPGAAPAPGHEPLVLRLSDGVRAVPDRRHRHRPVRRQDLADQAKAPSRRGRPDPRPRFAGRASGPHRGASAGARRRPPRPGGRGQSGVAARQRPGAEPAPRPARGLRSQGRPRRLRRRRRGRPGRRRPDLAAVPRRARLARAADARFVPGRGPEAPGRDRRPYPRGPGRRIPRRRRPRRRAAHAPSRTRASWRARSTPSVR